MKARVKRGLNQAYVQLTTIPSILDAKEDRTSRVIRRMKRDKFNEGSPFQPSK